MSGTLGDLLAVADFDDLATIHYCDSGGEIADYWHGVGNKKIRQAEVALQLREQVDDLRADAHIERGDWLIGDDEFGAEGEGARDADTLALASAEFVGKAREDGFVETDGSDEFKDSSAEGEFGVL